MKVLYITDTIIWALQEPSESQASEKGKNHWQLIWRSFQNQRAEPTNHSGESAAFDLEGYHTGHLSSQKSDYSCSGESFGLVTDQSALPYLAEEECYGFLAQHVSTKEGEWVSRLASMSSVHGK
jgi:hypothetical protein